MENLIKGAARRRSARERFSFGVQLLNAALHRNKLTTALVNKLARVASCETSLRRLPSGGDGYLKPVLNSFATEKMLPYQLSQGSNGRHHYQDPDDRD
jgi:hypothetical protein